MKKLIAVAVLAAFSSLPYAAEKTSQQTSSLSARVPPVPLQHLPQPNRALKSSALKRKAWSAEQVISPKVFSLSAPRCSATTTFL